jgi:SEC-C motif-containing protein
MIMALPAHQKAGRNDPCPCGSGKKYKQCCLKAVSASDDNPWSQQHDASGRLAQEMLSFAMENFARDLDAAWLDFNQDDAPVPIQEDSEESQIFVPYRRTCFVR